MIKKLSLLAAFALLPIATLSAKSKAEKPDFSGLKGNYTGTSFVTFSSGTTSTASGAASIQVAVSGKGKSATVTINGSVFAEGSTIPLTGSFTLTKSAFSGGNALFGLTSTGPFSIPGKLSKKGFTANGTATISSTLVLIQSSVKVKPQGKKKQKITITYTISAGSAFYSFQFTGTGKAHKVKE